MYCKVCGRKLPDNAVYCDECGTPTGVKKDGAQDSDGDGQNANDGYNPYGKNEYGQDESGYHYGGEYGNGHGYGQPPDNTRRGFAITALVLGIVGLCCACCSFATVGFFSLLLGVLGLIFGILGLKSRSRGLAIAGIVLAVINLAVGVFLCLFILALIPEYY